MREITGLGTGNLLLDSLSSADRYALVAETESIGGPLGEEVYAQRGDMPYVYFPITAVYSLVIGVHNGQKAEVASVGNEGMVGVPLLLGLRQSVAAALRQVPGRSLRIRSERFLSILHAHSAINAVLLRYAGYTLHNVSQGAACNALHSLEARASRWLLSAQDRAGTTTFELTQELLGQMLGVTRQSVGIVAAALQREGLIKYQRGTVKILDRQRLKGSACECYEANNRFYRTMMEIERFPAENREEKRRAEVIQMHVEAKL